MRRCYRLLLFTAVALCLGSLSVLAQATSSLRGKVSDAQGGALPGVTVVLKNAETAFSREVVTDETGSYSLLQVPPGSAVLSVQRLACLPDGRPLEFVQSLMRGDRYRVVLELEGHGARR